MKILIVDDEQPARARLRRLMEELPMTNSIQEASTGMEALRLCEKNAPDVALLDIRMPGMTGLELARHLANLESAPAIIFTTAFDEYALAAFETHAVDYLLKPIRQDKLAKALDAAKKINRVQLQQIQQDIQAKANHALASGGQRSHISARVGTELRLVPIDDVRYFLAEDKYVTVQYTQGQLLIEDPLKSLAREFADRFLRAHRNALVALHFIAALECDNQGHCRIRIKGTNEMIDVSRRHLPFVRKILKQL